MYTASTTKSKKLEGFDNDLFVYSDAKQDFIQVELRVAPSGQVFARPKQDDGIDQLPPSVHPMNHGIDQL